jgi:hypothetical protein
MTSLTWEFAAVSVYLNGFIDPDLRERLRRIQFGGLIGGALALALCAGACAIWPDAVLQSYLVGFMFWIGIALGSLGLTMLHHLVGGSWGMIVRRPMESAGMTLLPLALLFLPLALGLGRLYPWARPDAALHDPDLAHKLVYLNPAFFLIRAAVYFATWLLLAWALSHFSRTQDERADLSISGWLQALSGPGLVVLFLTGTFSAIDWMMSLEPKWASTIYGAMVVVGQALATLAAMILVAVLLSRNPPIAGAAAPDRLNDLGNLMLAFTMLWAYVSFSQFLIIWCGNLPEEIPWYLRRARGPWQWVALLLVLFHFFLPFFVLLFRESKRRARLLIGVAALILTMHWLDVVWLILPASADPASPKFPWLELPLSLLATLGIGGVWVSVFLGRLQRGPLIPLNDANLLAAAEQAAG